MERPRMARALKAASALNLILFGVVAACLFLMPGLTVVSDLSDPALGGPGVPAIARRVHRDLTPRIESWARTRIATRRATDVLLHDVPATEWPMFSAVFYLLATEELEADWRRRGGDPADEPMAYARGAVEASRDLIVDPGHHTWVRTHWGEGYLHEENVFFRSLLISGLTSYERLTEDGSALPALRDQVETLVADLDASELGLLNDYPGECYPIDVFAAVGIIGRADEVLGTDHSAFIERERRAFVGERADELGLVPFRVALPDGEMLQPGRGVGTSWYLVFAPELYPEEAERWYAAHEAHFWQERSWAHGFREFASGSPIARGYGEWSAEVDAGPILGGFGTAASAFGLAAARRNGRFDHAYTLGTEMVATSWPLPDGTLLLPRVVSSAADAPYLGEAAISYFLALPPAEGVNVVRGGRITGLVAFTLLVYFGMSGLALFAVTYRLRDLRRRSFTCDAPAAQLGLCLALTLGGGALLLSGSLVWGLALLLLGHLFPRLEEASEG